METKKRDSKKYATGFSDNLEPLKALDLSKVKNFDDFAKRMSKTSFGARNLGIAVDVLHEMVTDKDCLVVMTLSGAMTMAKQGLLVCEMIDRGFVNAIVSTGALITHGLSEEVGFTHFKNPGNLSDHELFDMDFDRVYDTLEDEYNLDNISANMEKIFDTFDRSKPLCSHLLCEAIGKYLKETTAGRGILKSAYEKNIPIFIPAFSDSELGLDLAVYRRGLRKANKPDLSFDPFLDLERYTDLFFKSKKAGIFTIGGGVPRNWAQQVGPYLDLIKWKLIDKEDTSKYKPYDTANPYIRRFDYAVRICPEPVHWGGLSGCTYSEGVSWGKFVPENKGGRFAEVYADATIAWPVILKAVIQRMESK